MALWIQAGYRWKPPSFVSQCPMHADSGYVYEDICLFKLFRTKTTNNVSLNINIRLMTMTALAAA